MKTLKHQQQPSSDTCVSACIAMILNQPVSEVINDFHQEYLRGEIDVDEYLHIRGIKCVPLMSTISTMLWDRVYFLSVPSLNKLGYWHQVLGYFENDKFVLLDPNKGREDKLYYVEHDVEFTKPNEFRLKSYLYNFEVWFPDYREAA